MKHKQRSWKFLWMLILCFSLQGLSGIAYAIDPNQVDDFVQRADHGDPQAEYVLGIAFLKGDGTIQNDLLAKQYLQRAAAHGHQEAQIQLNKLLHPEDPIIPLTPNFDRTLPLQPKSRHIEAKSSHIEPKAPKKKRANQNTEKKGPLMLYLIEIALILAFIGFLIWIGKKVFFIFAALFSICAALLLGLAKVFIGLFSICVELLVFCFSLFLPKKQQKAVSQAESYQIITDLKGRM